MKHIIRLGVLSFASLLVAASNSISVVAVGDETIKHVILAELSPGSTKSGSEEYVELFNPNLFEADVTGWSLQYRSYSHGPDDADGWTTKAIIGCDSVKAGECPTPKETTIGAGDARRLSSFEAADGILPLASGMSATGGELRLVQPATVDGGMVVHDKVGYGNAKDYEGSASAAAPQTGQSIVRVRDAEGIFVDTDQNGADFVANPDADEKSDPDPTNAASSDSPDTPPAAQEAEPVAYLDAEITEVLPDPVSPNMDSSDEFIELYNPYGQPLDLAGYTLKTGTGWTHKYVIGGITVDSYGYVALMSAQTHLSLSNSGSGVRLYDPAGRLVFEVPNYGKAKEGDSWIRDAQGQWVWTAQPTPGEQNTFTAPPEKQATTSAATKKTTTAKKTTAKKAPNTKTTGAVKGLTTTASQPAQAEQANNQVGMWALAGAAVLGVGYALFEYRHDIGDFFRRRWQSLRGK